MGSHVTNQNEPSEEKVRFYQQLDLGIALVGAVLFGLLIFLAWVVTG